MIYTREPGEFATFPCINSCAKWCHPSRPRQPAGYQLAEIISKARRILGVPVDIKHFGVIV